MSNFVKLAAETTDSYLAALAEGQDNFLKSVATFNSWTPAYPNTPAAAFQGLPTIQEITEVSFAWAQKLLKQQQDFATKLIAATEPTVAAAPKSTSAKSRS